MALTFAASTFDDHDMDIIMQINNKAMKDLFHDTKNTQVLFDSLDDVRNFLMGCLTVIVEFYETPIAYFRYYMVKTNTMKMCHLGPLAILPEYNTSDVNKLINSFVTYIAKNNNCKYILIETIESNAELFINDGYVEYAKHISGNLPTVCLKKLIL